MSGFVVFLQKKHQICCFLMKMLYWVLRIDLIFIENLYKCCFLRVFKSVQRCCFESAFFKVVYCCCAILFLKVVVISVDLVENSLCLNVVMLQVIYELLDFK
jgi:hypothetical protein